jgi:hypothetical protein
MKTFIIIFPLILSALLSCNNSNNNTTQNIETKLDTLVVQTIMPYDTFEYKAYDHIASFLAGAELNDSCSDIKNQFETDAWKAFSKEFNKNWKGFENDVLNTVSEWSEQHLNYTDSMFYPFSGPDFNYLNAFFPNTKFSVLIGLEKIGSIPKIKNLDDNKLNEYLNALRNSIRYNLEYSFFRTRGMAEDLNSDLIDGTIPLLLLFMKSHNYEIINVYPVSINSEGLIVADTINEMFKKTTEKQFNNGVAFIYKDTSESDLRQLVYFSLDISDDSINSKKHDRFFTNYISGNTTFLKAASYLCHRETFVIIKNHILNNSKQIITDPSGMPLRDFNNSWALTIHGNYVGPINLFAERLQTDLRDTCKILNNDNLPFRFGYHYTQWCLIYAQKK